MPHRANAAPHGAARGRGATGRPSPPVTPIYRDVLPGSRPAGALRPDLRQPLVKDGAATLEGDPARRLQHVRQTLRRLEEMDEDVQRVDRLLIEELKEADRREVAAVATIAPVTAVTATGEGDGVDAVGVGLLGEEEKRILAGAGKDAHYKERQPAGGEDRRRGES